MYTRNGSKQMYELCKKHMHSYVLAETEDGMKIDGIITGLDEENVYMAVPNDAYNEAYGMRQDDPDGMNDSNREFGYPFYPGFGYGYGPPFGYYPGPRRRFRRVILPLAALTALSLLAWY